MIYNRLKEPIITILSSYHGSAKYPGSLNFPISTFLQEDEIYTETSGIFVRTNWTYGYLTTQTKWLQTQTSILNVDIFAWKNDPQAANIQDYVLATRDTMLKTTWIGMPMRCNDFRW